jgi:hypothetical protein
MLALVVQIRKDLRREDEEAAVGCGRVPAYDAGITGGWVLAGPCHKQRFLRWKVDPAVTTGAAAEGANSRALLQEGVAARLLSCVQELLCSSAFAKWLRQVTDLGVRALRTELRRFRPGLDYTVATGVAAEMPRLDATLCFVHDDSDEAAAAWASDDLGGFQCYILGDDEANAAADTYRCDCLPISLWHEVPPRGCREVCRWYSQECSPAACSLLFVAGFSSGVATQTHEQEAAAIHSCKSTDAQATHRTHMQVTSHSIKEPQQSGNHIPAGIPGQADSPAVPKLSDA